MRKDSFLYKCKSKLMPRTDGPFTVLERVNDNAYKVNLPRDFSVSATFNVTGHDLGPQISQENLSSSITV